MEIYDGNFYDENFYLIIMYVNLIKRKTKS